MAVLKDDEKALVKAELDRQGYGQESDEAPLWYHTLYRAVAEVDRGDMNLVMDEDNTTAGQLVEAFKLVGVLEKKSPEWCPGTNTFPSHPYGTTECDNCSEVSDET